MMHIIRSFQAVSLACALALIMGYANAGSLGDALRQGLSDTVRDWPQEARDSNYNQYKNQVSQERDAGSITNMQRVQLLRQKRQEIYGPFNSYQKEYWDFGELVAYRRDTQGLSEQEANYLLQQKENELAERMARNSAPQKNVDIKCKMDCTSRGYQWDYCDSRCSY